MKTKKVVIIYLTGFFIATSLIMFPACSNIFLSEDFHGFTDSKYGLIFIPQIVLAIITSLTASKLGEKIGLKKVLLLGILVLISSLLLLASTELYLKNHFSYYAILIATALVGAGFGLSLTAINTFAINLFPDHESSALSGLHVLTGLGGAGSGFIINFFMGIELWWMGPLAVSGILALSLVFIWALKLETKVESSDAIKSTDSSIPLRVWFYALLVFLYGCCEALLNNYGAVYIEKEAGLSTSVASTGLSILWISIAVGRAIYAFIAIKHSTKWLYIIVPFVLFSSLFLIPFTDSKLMVLSCMAIGGLGLSFIFPNTISTATSEFPQKEVIISGLMVAALQLGSGVSSNLVGFLSDANRENPIELSALFQYFSFSALVIGGLVIYLTFSRNKELGQ